MFVTILMSHVGVSKAILEQAGQNVEMECSRLGKAQCCFLVLNCKWKLNVGDCRLAGKSLGIEETIY